MRHVSVYALWTLSGFSKTLTWEHAWLIRACDWDTAASMLTSDDARLLLAGTQVMMPTCPQCLVMMDIALEMRK